MKIAIDVGQIIHGTGVSFYTSNLVKGLAQIDKKNDYLLIGVSLRQKKKLVDFGRRIQKINPRFQSRFFSLPISLAEKWGNQWRWGSLEKFIGPIDIFHSSDWIQPPVKAVKVTTIHDFGFFKYPQTAHPKILRVMNRRLGLVKKEADLIIAVSKTTAEDTKKFLGIPENKIKVIYEAAIEEHQKKGGKLKIKGSYLLSVANLDPRKNLTRIIEAFFQVKKEQPKLKLVIVGKPGWEKLGKLGGDIVFAGYVDDQELAGLYRGASCLVYPSLDEGFGLPILEAMKNSCPVVTSNLSSMPEVAGKSAVLVNPFEVKEIARGIKEAFKRRQELVKRGLTRVKKFSWEKCARETIEVYEQAFKAKQA